MEHRPGPNLSEAEVGRLVEVLDHASEAERREIMTKLAWRPAWAVRSRRGAVATLRDLFKRRA